MNPYASHLGDRDPLEVTASTPARLAALLDGLGPAGPELRLAPGKWTIREILCHLADTELTFAVRIRHSLAEPHHVIQPFDQDVWAVNYAAYDANSALAMFSAVRDWNVKLVRSLPADTFGKPLTHPERGMMTLQVLIETMGGHDLNHLAQIEAIAAR